VSRKLIPIVSMALVATACAGQRFSVTPGGVAEDAFLTQVVERAELTGLGLSLAADADGNPHLSYLSLAPEDPAAAAPVPGEPLLPAVKHAHYVGSAWTRSAVAEEVEVGDADETAIAVGPDGTHHVAWTQEGTLFYSSNAGGEFSEPEKVAAGGVVGISATTDGDGAPWLAFYISGAMFCRIFPDGEPCGTDLVRVATLEGGGWETETAAEASIPALEASGAVVAGTGIGVTPDGPVVAYGSEGRTLLARDTGDLWESETVDRGGFGVSLAADGDGNPHLAYQTQNGAVRHAHSIDGAAWEPSDVGEGHTDGRTSIALDGEGVHYVAFQTTEGVELASNEGGQFASLDVPGTEGGAWPKVVAGPEGMIAMSWFGPKASGVYLSARGLEEPFLAAPPGGGQPTGEPTGQPTDGGPPPCEPSGTELSVVAANIAFDTDCLAAPADTAFTIAFDNQDTQPHNVGIYDQQGGQALFTGETFQGPDSRTYEVDPLAAGQYYFQCDVHPTMNGAFVSA